VRIVDLGAHEIGVMAGHTGPIKCLITFIASDGRPRIASGGEDKKCNIFDAWERRLIHTLDCEAVVYALSSYCTEGGLARVVTGNAGGRVAVWDGVEGAAVQSVKFHTMYIWCVASYKGLDGSCRVISCGGDKYAVVFDGETGEKVMDLVGHTRSVVTITLTTDPETDGQLILTGSYDGHIGIWDGESGASLRMIQAHRGDVLAIGVCWDEAGGGGKIVSGGRDDHVTCWDLRSGAELSRFGRQETVHTLCVYRTAEHEDRVASFGNDGKMQIWGITMARLLQESLAIHKTTIWKSICFVGSNDVCYMAVGSWDGQMSLWNLGPAAPPVFSGTSLKAANKLG
jgi:WD40 repeat protein